MLTWKLKINKSNNVRFAILAIKIADKSNQLVETPQVCLFYAIAAKQILISKSILWRHLHNKKSMGTIIFRKFYPLKDKKSELSEVFMAKKVKDCIWVTIGTISERNMLRIHTFYAIYLVLTHRVNRYYMEFNWKGPVQKWIQWIFHPLMWYLKLLNTNRLVLQWQKTQGDIRSLTELIIQIIIFRT